MGPLGGKGAASRLPRAPLELNRLSIIVSMELNSLSRYRKNAVCTELKTRVSVGNEKSYTAFLFPLRVTASLVQEG